MSARRIELKVPSTSRTVSESDTPDNTPSNTSRYHAADPTKTPKILDKRVSAAEAGCTGGQAGPLEAKKTGSGGQRASRKCSQVKTNRTRNMKTRRSGGDASRQRTPPSHSGAGPAAAEREEGRSLSKKESRSGIPQGPTLTPLLFVLLPRVLLVRQRTHRTPSPQRRWGPIY